MVLLKKQRIFTQKSLSFVKTEKYECYLPDGDRKAKMKTKIIRIILTGIMAYGVVSMTGCAFNKPGIQADPVDEEEADKDAEEDNENDDDKKSSKDDKEDKVDEVEGNEE